MKYSHLSIVCVSLVLVGCGSTEGAEQVLKEGGEVVVPDSLVEEMVPDRTAPQMTPDEVEASVSSFIAEYWPDIEVTVEADDTGRVTLKGVVASEKLKEEIDAEVDNLPGVERLRNSLKVQ